MRAVPIAGSLVVNAAVLALVGLLSTPRDGVPDAHGAADPAPMEVSLVSAEPAPAAVATPASHGGGGGSSAAHARVAAPAHSAWDDVAMHVDDPVAMGGGDGGGDGTGHGGGRGNGIGLGDGGGIAEPANVPAAPEPPRPAPSHKRAARLLYPSRQSEVDADDLFHVIVTVDTDGDVVGAHFVRTLPGSRGETASTMIWQFRYDPARDDDGNRVRSTFEQTFAVR